MTLVTGMILLFLGLLACFFGWRFFRVVMGLQGFVIGFYLAHRLLAGQADAISLIVGVVGGVILFAVFYQFLYNFAFVVLGAVLGLAIAGLVDVTFSLDGGFAVIIAVALAVVGAIAGNLLSDLMIRISTAFSGAAQAIGGLAAIGTAIGATLPLADLSSGGATTDSTSGIVTVIAVIVLGIIGFIIQSQNAPTTT